MSNYTKATNFATKDALTTGNPLKTLSGTELDDEFNAIQVANNTKANASNAALTGTPTAPTAAADTSTTQLATTAFVTTEAALKADLAGAAFTGAIKVKFGRITSSSLLIPRLAKAKCRAVVPLVTDKQYFDLTNLEKDFSNNLTYFPPEDIHPEFMQSFK